jgi:hypothetical protein
MFRHEFTDDVDYFGWDSRIESRYAEQRNNEPDESNGSDWETQYESDEPEYDSEKSYQDGPAGDVDFDEWRLWDRYSPKHRSYELVKQRVERRCFRVASPRGYAVIPRPVMRGPSMIAELITAAEMKVVLKDIVYFRPHAEAHATSHTEEMIPQSFYPRWQRDVTIRTYEGITFAPGMPEDDRFNLWRGYTAAMLPPVPDAEVDALAAPFFHHIRAHCAEPEYVISWIAKVLHRPEQRTNVALLFHGDPAAGFECIPNVMRETLTGPTTTFQTYAHKRDIFGIGTRHHLNKTLIQMDGLSREDFQLRGPAMNALITGEALTFKLTWRHECTDNYINVILTSYTVNTLAVHDPAIKKIRCTPATEDDRPRLRSTLANPRVQRAVFQAMMRHIE